MPDIFWVFFTAAHYKATLVSVFVLILVWLTVELIDDNVHFKKLSQPLRAIGLGALYFLRINVLYIIIVLFFWTILGTYFVSI